MEKALKLFFKEIEIIQIEIDHRQKASNVLFYKDEYPFLIINGFSSELDYLKHIKSHHKAIQKKIDRHMNQNDLDSAKELRHQLQLLHSETDHFFKCYYQNDYPQINFLRVNISLVPIKNQMKVFEAQSKIEVFLNIQRDSLKRILELLESRIRILTQSIKTGNLGLGKSFVEIDSQKSLFIQEKFDFSAESRPVYLWNGSKSEILYLLYLLQNLEKFKSANGKKVTDSGIYEFFGQILGFSTENAENLIQYVKNHQKVENTIISQLIEIQDRIYR